MANKRQNRIYSKTRNRGRMASFTVHLLLLLVAFLPFLSFHAPEEPTKEALVIQFDYPYNQYVAPEKFVKEEPLKTGEPSKMSGSEAGGNKTVEEPMHSRPREAAPAPLATPVTPTALKTPPAPIRSPLSDVPLPMPKIYTHASTTTSTSWQSIEDVSA
ncbi:MAG TPA: hypothetical protein VJ508_06155, partial [Saprospiraceae bacterium]|nr:hypothetical protein [Saprospiraceae bacterium]